MFTTSAVVTGVTKPTGVSVRLLMALLPSYTLVKPPAVTDRALGVTS